MPIKITFEKDHPAFAGHFPGNPLVPGALLLATAVDHLEKNDSCSVKSIASAKFLKPVVPGDECVLRVMPIDPASLRLIVSVNEENALVAVLRLKERKTA